MSHGQDRALSGCWDCWSAQERDPPREPFAAINHRCEKSRLGEAVQARPQWLIQSRQPRPAEARPRALGCLPPCRLIVRRIQLNKIRSLDLPVTQPSSVTHLMKTIPRRHAFCKSCFQERGNGNASTSSMAQDGSERPHGSGPILGVSSDPSSHPWDNVGRRWHRHGSRNRPQEVLVSAALRAPDHRGSPRVSHRTECGVPGRLPPHGIPARGRRLLANPRGIVDPRPRRL